MKIALLATMLAFGGSLAGFGLSAGVSSDPPATDQAAAPRKAVMQDVVVRGKDRDCPKAVVAAERT